MNCRTCGVPVVFAAFAVSKRPAPFELDAAGSWAIDDGIARHVGPIGAQLELGGVPEERFTSHFARCPQAAQWRRDRDQG